MLGAIKLQKSFFSQKVFTILATTVYSKIKEINLSLQGKTVTLFFNENAKAYSSYEETWLECVWKEYVDCFLIGKRLLNKNNIQLKKITEKFWGISETLKDSFEHYILIAQKTALGYFKWALNMFSVKRKTPSLNLKVKYYVLIDLAHHSELKIAFQKKSLPEFWCHLTYQFIILSEKEKIIFLPFSTTYFCEAEFSVYTATMTQKKVF